MHTMTTASTDPIPFVLAVLSQKGGVGKTTLSLNLGAAAHLSQRRTLILDCDPQGSSFQLFCARGDASGLAGLAVARADRALSLPKFRELAKGYEVVILDGPPRLGDVTRAAAAAADVVLIPARPSAIDTWACSDTLDVLDSADDIRAQLGRPALRRVIVINAAPPRSRTLDRARSALRDAAELADVEVGNRVVFAAAAATGESVLTAAPHSRAAEEVRRLWSTLTRKVGSES
jgi:chromosome partitioning protein